MTLPDAELPAATRMLLALASVPPIRRLETLAFVMKVFIERPDWLAVLAAARPPGDGRGAAGEGMNTPKGG